MLRMKLSEFIYARAISGDSFTEEEIEEWIVDWYGKTFHQPNLGGVEGAAKGKPALPPLWLADWHPRIRPLHEQEACGIDEG